MKKTGKLSCIFLLLLFLLAGESIFALSKSAIDFDAEYFGLYESNIYHTYYDTAAIGSMLNVLKADLNYETDLSKNLEQSFNGYLDMDLYPNYSNRNRSAFGVKSVTKFNYGKKASFEAKIDISRRNKDLVDDNGVTLSKTLKKWNQEIFLINKIKHGKLKSEQSIGYVKHNYDEVTGTTSYDYDYMIFSLDNEVKLSKKFQTEFNFSYEDRSYDERKTYSIQYGAVAGRPFEIRELQEYEIESELKYNFNRRSDISFNVTYLSRKENFENFYGYKYWQYKMKFDYQLNDRNDLNISFRFKDKDYDNYWTSRIGQNNRVAIDYADFQIEHNYLVATGLELMAFIRNYNKVSNDILFDYQDTTIGIGFKYSY